MKRYYKNPEKRIYSINLLAFVEMETGQQAKLYKEEDLLYGVFPEGQEEILKAITAFRNPECMIDLHKYLQAYKGLRIRMKAMREE